MAQKSLDYRGLFGYCEEMKFELETDNWHLKIELQSTPNYRPDGKFSSTPKADLQSWREGSLAFFSVFITSSRLESADSDDGIDQMIHYSCGLLLPVDPEELQEDLEIILDEEGLLDHIFNHWELQGSSNGPEWRHP